MITIIQDKLKPMVVSSMLDHDSLHGNTQGKSIEVNDRKVMNQENYKILELACPLSHTGFDFSFSLYISHIHNIKYTMYTLNSAQCIAQ